MADLLLDHGAQVGQLGVSGLVHLLGGIEEGRQAVAILDQVLLPADKIDVLQQHLDLATDQQCLEGRIVDLDIRDFRFVHLVRCGFNPIDGCVHVFQLPPNRQGKRAHRTLHPL